MSDLVIIIDTPYGEEATCGKCGNSAEWVDCDDCEDGYSYHDCGEDTCCCLHPLPNVVCDVCDGKGGFYVCICCGREPKYCSCKPLAVGNEDGDALK